MGSGGGRELAGVSGRGLVDLSATGRGQEGEFCGGVETGVRETERWRLLVGCSGHCALSRFLLPASGTEGEADVRAQHVPSFVMQRPLETSPGLPGGLAHFSFLFYIQASNLIHKI
jgi:hypothetical protein